MTRYAAGAAALAAGIWVLAGCPGSSSSNKGTVVPAGPTVQFISPATGDTNGGLSVSIFGSDFDSAATVTIGGTPATNVVMVTPVELAAVTPAAVSTGPVDVVVTNPDLQFGTLPGGFTYFPPPGGVLSLVTVAPNLDFPIALAFAPDWATTDRLFFTEKNTGLVRIIQGGAPLPQPFISVSVATGCEEGLLGIAFDPNYAANSYVYVFYDVAGPTVVQRLERYTDSANVGTNPFVLLDNLPSNNCNHNGGNIAFGPDGMLYLTLGEDAVPAWADDDNVFPGKILRMNPDGTAAVDNPWYDAANPTDPISYFFCKGLRNSFDLGFHPLTGDLFASENGWNVSDEINLIQAGNHYGWDSSMISGPRGAPFTDPVDFFSPPPSLTGVGFSRGYRYPESFDGDMFFGAWNTSAIYRVDMTPPNYNYDQGSVTIPLSAPDRVTDIVGGPDGYIYVATGRRGGQSDIYRLEYN